MSDVHQDGALTLTVTTTEQAIDVVWAGKSTARDPGAFLTPILGDALEHARAAGVPLVLDFRTLEYMSSSTIAPVIRMLHEAKGGTDRVLVVYDGTSRWQGLGFTALTMFQTPDRRIEIRGARPS